MDEQNDILSTKEAGEFLKLNPQIVSRKANKGEIPGFKIGKDWKFSKRALEEFVYNKSKENLNKSETK